MVNNVELAMHKEGSYWLVSVKVIDEVCFVAFHILASRQRSRASTWSALAGREASFTLGSARLARGTLGFPPFHHFPLDIPKQIRFNHHAGWRQHQRHMLAILSFGECS